MFFVRGAQGSRRMISRIRLSILMSMERI